METQREYLARLGLAKPGTRGRFSLAAKAELERARLSGMTFSDSTKAVPKKAAKTPKTTNTEEGEFDSLIPDESPVEYPKIPEKPKLRNIGRVIGYTAEGNKVASDICLSCAHHVNVCSCSGGIEVSPIVATIYPESEPYCKPLANSILV